jgi:hypothetical protein
MVIPEFTPDNTNNALAATMIVGQQQAQQAYANGVQLAIQRQQLQMQMGDYARRNGCTWYKQHWYSTPVCAPNAPALRPLESQEQSEKREWTDKLQAARIAHSDWDEVANRPEVKAMTRQPRVDAMIKVISNGPDVLYYLATEPGAFDKMKNMSEDQQLAEAWRISHLLREQR